LEGVEEGREERVKAGDGAAHPCFREGFREGFG
jgi:hypothetical protein